MISDDYILLIRNTFLWGDGMQNRRGIYTGILSVGLMIFMILDSKTVLEGAVEGIQLCLWTVTPSLFPFFIVSSIVRGNIPKFRKFLSIDGSILSAYMLGLLGGYPVGAQNVAASYRCESTSKRNAEKILAFCSNPGPAFLFGIAAPLFSNPLAGWCLWGVTILSSLCTGYLSNLEFSAENRSTKTTPVTLQSALTTSLRAIASVCGWVVLFRVLLTVLNARLPWIINGGILELTNGILNAKQISLEPIRFLVCCFLLNFGGLCVGMQTASVAGNLSMHWYYIGKLIQATIALLSGILFLPLLYGSQFVPYSIIAGLVLVVIMVGSNIYKKRVAFSGKLIYNIRNT